MNKKLLRILAVVALGAAIAAGFYFYDLKKHPPKPQQQFGVDKKDLAASQLPKAFPANLPIEPGSQILQNYEATTTDGRFQSDRVMTTNKTLAQVVKTYTDFFTKLGWTVSSTNSTDDFSNALLRKDNDTLLIIARINPDTKQKTVELTLTQAPK